MNFGRYYLFFFLLFFLISGCKDKPSLSEKSHITIKGSDTMALLLSVWAENFMKVNPNIDVTISESDSAGGIEALINQTVDIAPSSRPISSDELRIAREKNIDIKEYIVARDAIVLIINLKNPVKSISLQDIEGIFTGKYVKWNELKGPDIPISVYSRDKSSGTFMFFQEFILNKKDISKKVNILQDNSSILEKVSQNYGGIAFIGFEYAFIVSDKIKIVGVKTKDNKSIIPSMENIRNGSYPISRNLYLYINSESSDNIKKFVNYCFSQQGQQFARENKYVPVK